MQGLSQAVTVAPIEIHIDGSAEEVTLKADGKTRTYRKQWYEFYALLGLLRSDSPTNSRLEQGDLSTVGCWSSKAPLSGGKEVSRHIKEVSAKLPTSPLKYKQKTSGWYLHIDPTHISWYPSKDAIAASMRARGWKTQLDPHWLALAVEYTIKLNQGLSDEAASIAKAMTLSSDEPSERAVAILFRYRALSRAGTAMPQDLLQLIEEVKRAGTDQFYRSIAIRMDLANIYEQRFDDPERALTALGRLLTDSDKSSDLATQASLMNAMAVVSNKVGRFEQSESLLARVIRISLVVGDLYLLQSALFNFAHTLYHSKAREFSLSASSIFAVLEAECKLRDLLNSGKDNIQTEVLAIATAVKISDLGRCEQFISRVKSLLTESISTYDQACFNRVFAKYIWLRERDSPPAQRVEATSRELRIARKLFDKSGHKAEKLDAELQATAAGLGPFSD